MCIRDRVEGAVLMPSYMKNDDQKAIFANAKVNDVLVFNPNVAYDCLLYTSRCV